MAEHARLGGQLLDDQSANAWRSSSRAAGADDDAAIRFDEVLGEEVQLPRQLLDVEGDPYGQISGSRARRRALQRRDERDGLAVARGVLGRRSPRRGGPAA